ncbi:MAG: TIGR02680 family protein [Umezawaea sp.]
MTLPQPLRLRWQPLRVGLVDLFYYDQEEFHFRDGRLLLRGNNGTGKSKVLALTLPFLLDGELGPHRVEPDADPKKRMEWNLLLGGAHPYPERLGYTWIEFGRVTEDGTEEFRTLGCGLKAVAGRGIARHWFFVSSQRVGVELRLVDATSTALSRDRLVEALGDRGMVYDRARDYRRAVDEALFGLGEQRYTALVDLLVQLRAPQLSKRPSEKALSNALTESLPPLDQAVVADVAEAFRSLEEDRDSLTAMTEAHQSAESFLGHYRRYGRVASRRRAAVPRQAQAAYERVNRELAEAQTACEQAQAALAAAEHELAELAEARVRLHAKEAALRESPEMRSADELRRAAVDAERAGTNAERLAGERDQAASQVTRRQRKVSETSARLTESNDALDTARRSALTAARDALIADAHAELAEPDIRQQAERLADRQQRAIAHIESLLGAHEQAQRDLVAARQRVDELAADAETLAIRCGEADDEVSAQGVALTIATRRHLDVAVELQVTDPAAVLAALELWCETLDGPNPARQAIESAGHTAAGELAREDAGLLARLDVAERRESELVAEITRLEAGEHTAPPPPHTRAPKAREGRLGAPLWQLVDFVDGVPETDRAGLEAALEAAGVLDAWVTPTGELRSPDTDDVFLSAESSVPDTGLAGMLRPAVDREDRTAAAVSDETVARLLDVIGLDSGPTRVGTDGRFRVGVLEGSWHKPAAVYIGRGAREAARRERLAMLRAELTAVREESATITAAREEVARRSRVLADEVRACPTDTSLRGAHAAVTALGDEQRRLADKRRFADDRVGLAGAAARTKTDELAEAGGELELPTDRQGLAAVRDGLNRYRLALADLLPALRRQADAHREADEAEEELVGAQEVLLERAELAAHAGLEATTARQRHQTLASTVGSAVAELERQLAEVARELAASARSQREADGRRGRAQADQGRAEGRVELLTDQLTAVTDERLAAAESLRRFARTGLLAVALPELEVPDETEPWAPDPTVRLARQIERDLAEVADDDAVWDRVQRRVTEELKTLADTLSRHANSASARLLDDGIVVDVVFQGRATTAPELASSLAAEVGERQRLLDEREREILENHLVNEVASTLQELISAAEAQVGGMNAELAERPTSTGMLLRLRWLPVEDGPAGLGAARERLLRQTADAWSEDDRSAVGAFLQAQIAEVRSRDTAGTWLEHLTEALDYRSWHRFAIQRHQNGQWKSATGPASGGERVLAASVPLFAAASSHYASAGNPHAPRLVTLDEAFAGVDDDSRAKCMGLLAAFDLDVVMTSEREWGCYPEVPGLAISQLSRTDDVAAVLVTPWEWDGRRRVRVGT